MAVDACRWGFIDDPAIPCIVFLHVEIETSPSLLQNGCRQTRATNSSTCVCISWVYGIRYKEQYSGDKGERDNQPKMNVAMTSNSRLITVEMSIRKNISGPTDFRLSQVKTHRRTGCVQPIMAYPNLTEQIRIMHQTRAPTFWIPQSHKVGPPKPYKFVSKPLNYNYIYRIYHKW